MTTLPHRARIGLAELRYYAFDSTETADPLFYLLFKTPGGLGIAYIGLIVFLFLILRGQTIRQATSSGGNAPARQFRGMSLP